MCLYYSCCSRFIPARLSLVPYFCRKERTALVSLPQPWHHSFRSCSLSLSLSSSVLKTLAFPVAGRLYYRSPRSASGRAVRSSSSPALSNWVRKQQGLLIRTELALWPPQGWWYWDNPVSQLLVNSLKKLYLVHLCCIFWLFENYIPHIIFAYVDAHLII